MIGEQLPRKILMLLPVLGQPRYAKRVEMLRSEGVDVIVLAYEREYHKGRLPDCPIQILGTVRRGDYWRRIIVYLGSLKKVRSESKRCDVVYSFGLDMFFLSVFSTLLLRKKLVLEIGDVREIQTSMKMQGILFRKVEKSFVRLASLLVVTSKSFYDGYYKQWLGLNIRNLVLENKVESSYKYLHLENASLPTYDKKFKISIGYFGLIRCEWSCRALYTLATCRPDDIEVIVAGHIFDDSVAVRDLLSLSNVTYKGKYRSPHDLPNLYGSVDIVWACYKPIGIADWNLKWARTNRFYESLFFSKPMIARSGSGDAKAVDSFAIGLVVCVNDPDEILVDFSVVDRDKLGQWSATIKKIDECVYMYSNDANRLVNALWGV